MTKESTVFDSSLLIRHDVGKMPLINAAFIQQARARAHIASQLFIYDQLAIPTHDYGVVAALVEWFGKDIFLEALEIGTFKFARMKDLIGYVGNGVGISGYTIDMGNSGRPMQWWQVALFGEPSEAIRAQLRNLSTRIQESEIQQLVERILPHCSLCNYSNETFMRHIAHETYVEIQHSEELSNIVRTSVGAQDRVINLERLPGLAANQVRMGMRETQCDAIDVVLRVAEFHRDLVAAGEYPTADLYVPRGAQDLLARKLEKHRSGSSRTSGVFKLLDLNGLPSVEEAVASQRLDLGCLWHLRQAKDGREFRQWLRRASPEDARELERLYVSALGSQPWISSLPSRILRFAITTAAGVLNPIVGASAGVVDSFFLERWLRGYSPKLFLDRYRDLLSRRGAGPSPYLDL